MSRRRHSTYRADEDATLYVRQVHYAARPDDLRVVFERMGPVRDVYIPLDYYTRESRGFAYVKYEDAGDAERAFRQLHGCAVLGRRICIEWAEGERKTKSEMREKEERAYGRYKRERRVSRSPPRRRFRERSSSSESRSKEPLSRKSSSARRGTKRSASRSPSVRGRKYVRRSSSHSSLDSVHSNENETIRRNSLGLERGVFDELEERSEDGDSDQQEVGNHTELVVSRAIKPVKGKKGATYLKMKEDQLEVPIEHKEKVMGLSRIEDMEGEVEELLEGEITEVKSKAVIEDRNDNTGSKSKAIDDVKGEKIEKLTNNETMKNLEMKASKVAKPESKGGVERLMGSGSSRVEISCNANKNFNNITLRNDEISERRGGDVDDESQGDVAGAVIAKMRTEEAVEGKNFGSKEKPRSDDDSFTQNEDRIPEYALLDTKETEQLEAIEKVNFADESKEVEELREKQRGDSQPENNEEIESSQKKEEGLRKHGKEEYC